MKIGQFHKTDLLYLWISSCLLTPVQDYVCLNNLCFPASAVAVHAQLEDKLVRSLVGVTPALGQQVACWDQLAFVVLFGHLA